MPTYHKEILSEQINLTVCRNVEKLETLQTPVFDINR